MKPCSTCEPARIRGGGAPPHDIDIEATTAALQRVVDSGRVRVVRADVPLGEMLDLFYSDMKYTVVAYLECLDCRRTIFWGLCIRGAAIFKHVDASAAETHVWEKVPRRSLWAGASE